MADEPISGRGGSLILECAHGQKQLRAQTTAGKQEYHHPSNGTFTSIEIDDGTGNTQTITIKDPKKATFVLHYEVP